MGNELPIINLETARFECTFDRGCDGVCCRHGRPPVDEGEVERLGAHLERILPRLRPEARASVRRNGFLTLRHAERPTAGTQRRRLVCVLPPWLRPARARQ